MRINFTTRHFKSSDNVRDYAEKKVQRLSRYYDRIIDCEIVLDREKLNYVAEMFVKVYSQKLVAQERSEDIYKSIDLAVDKLERQLKKFKGKLNAHGNQKAKDIPPSSPAE